MKAPYRSPLFSRTEALMAQVRPTFEMQQATLDEALARHTAELLTTETAHRAWSRLPLDMKQALGRARNAGHTIRPMPTLITPSDRPNAPDIFVGFRNDPKKPLVYAPIATRSVDGLWTPADGVSEEDANRVVNQVYELVTLHKNEVPNLDLSRGEIISGPPVHLPLFLADIAIR